MPGGRPAGSVAKSSTRALELLLKSKYPNWQPVMEIAGTAHKLKEIAESQETALECFNEDGESLELSLSPTGAWNDYINACEKVANYLYPKLKAIEVNIEADIKLSYYVSGTPIKEIDGKVVEVDPEQWAAKHIPKPT